MNTYMLIAAVTLLGISSAVYAQRPGHPEERFERMKSHLALTESQAAEIKAIMGTNRRRMQEARADGNVTEEERRAVRQLRASSEREILALLNDEQKEKFKAMKKEQREHRARKHPEKRQQ